MQAFAMPFLVYYLAVIAVVCVYGVHRYWMVWAFLRRQQAELHRHPKRRFDHLPAVTVQLPMFNEKRVAARVIQAACAIDYPRELLQIQVLDDSTDDSARIARECCEQMRAGSGSASCAGGKGGDKGHNVEYVHRDNREGFKAGALAKGLESATGEFIAVFDADFVPPPDILHKTIHHFTDESVGMVQARWSHLNRGDSLLTQVQAMYLDGHFVIEQAARAHNGRWFNFNGTAGIWRRRAIEDAGGWQHDTLTEDTDLSYRAQLKGWKFRYLLDVCCPAEVPPTVSAFLSQQHRWNKGLVQTAIKLLPRIFKSDAPLRTKVEAWFHLTSPLVHVFILLLVVLVTPTMFVNLPLENLSPRAGLAVGALFLLLGMLAATTFYLTSQWAQGLSWWRTLVRLPALMALGVGISVTNSRAVLEAIFGRQSPFIRTPKYNGDTDSEADPVVHKSKRVLPNGSIELVLGLLMIVCVFLSFTRPHTIVAAPFLVLFACGYLSVAVPSLRAELRRVGA
jgi:cellulose synthase/poly-beta-1,6-N-acetylglucosamine synthase-like glycosyltransferase